MRLMEPVIWTVCALTSRRRWQLHRNGNMILQALKDHVSLIYCNKTTSNTAAKHALRLRLQHECDGGAAPPTPHTPRNNLPETPSNSLQAMTRGPTVCARCVTTVAAAVEGGEGGGGTGTALAFASVSGCTLQPFDFRAHFLLLLLECLLQLRSNGGNFSVHSLRNQRLGLLAQTLLHFVRGLWF